MNIGNLENEIQSWVAVRSFAVEDANPQLPIIDANELAEMLSRVFKKLDGCVVVPVTCPDPQFADAIFEELKTKAFDSFGDDAAVCLSDIDAEKIWSIALETARGGK